MIKRDYKHQNAECQHEPFANGWLKEVLGACLLFGLLVAALTIFLCFGINFY